MFFFSFQVALVERNTAPQGIPLLNPYAVAKKSPHDLVELAAEIQKVWVFSDHFINLTVSLACQIKSFQQTLIM